MSCFLPKMLRQAINAIGAFTIKTYNVFDDCSLILSEKKKKTVTIGRVTCSYGCDIVNETVIVIGPKLKQSQDYHESARCETEPLLTFSIV